MKHRALIVEDDPSIIHLVVDALASIGHEFDTACSQEEAHKRLAEKDHSYILLGIKIPARAHNGIARIQNTENLLEEIVESMGKDAPPVIILSDHEVEGRTATADAMCLALSLGRRGVADIIVKPFPTEGRTLDKVIKKVLAGRAAVRTEESTKRTVQPAIAGSVAHNAAAESADSDPGSASSPCLSGKPVSATSSTLTEMQLNILEAVAMSPHQTMFQADIIVAGGYGKYATRQCLQQLEGLGLIGRPQGERKGWAVTERGKAFIADVKSQSA